MGVESFTESELHQIDNRLDALLDYAAANYELTAEATTRLKGDVAYLKEAARRMSRLDWANTALGTSMGWLLAALVPPERFSGLFHQVLQIIHDVTVTIRLLTP